jgi:RimJ/RimL family protein N-acetyltransferase
MHARRAEFHLQGPTLAARLPRADDAPALARLGEPADALWPAWQAVGEPGPSWEAHVSDLCAERAAGHRLDLLFLDGAEAVVAAATLTELSAQDGRATATLWLADAVAASPGGTGAECVLLLAQLAFGSLGLARLGAQVPAGDAGTARAFVAAGFVAETTLRRWWRHDGEAVDVAGLALLAGEWAMLPQRPPVCVDGPIPSAVAATLAGSAR